IDHENPIATIKEEEWETRKKKEITTTRQIQTRVKRQVVLEDGEVIKDSGPLVTTNTTEDVEQQEHTTQERRKNGDDKPKEIEWNGSAGRLVQKELNETVVKSREEVEELLETEDRRQFGDITDEAYQQAIRNNNSRDLRQALAESSKQLSTESGPRVIQHTTKSSKVIDTEEKHERNELKSDGAIVTETKTSVTHEEIRDTPDHVNGLKDNDEPTETRRESSQKFIKKRNEDIVDYVLDGEVINREMRYVSETTEGNRVGDWPPPSTTMKTMWIQKPNGSPTENDTLNRKDALTKKPLDPEQEDEARKFETSKWLESHFGSESRSSHGSIEHDIPPVQTAANTSFINVTMKSCIPRDRKYKSSSSNSSNLHYRSHQQQSPQQPQQQPQSQPQQQQQQQHHQQSHHQRKTTSKGTGSGTTGGYFHGISEWSERYQASDKQNNNGESSSPSHCIIETQRSNGYSTHETPHRSMDTLKSTKETGYIRNYETTHNRHEFQQRSSPPSPPIRRRVRQQIISNNEDKNSNLERGTSPVQVIQRTWEKRNRDIHDHGRFDNIETRQTQTMYSPTQRYRSTSPVIKISLTPPLRRERKTEKVRSEKSSSNKRSRSPKGHHGTSRKSKIGESFRKLVDKLRSASTERNNKSKKSGISSTSQLTQTDDNSTYLQYNVIDKNIPEINKRDEINGKTPERPPRSPRNSTTSPVTKTIKVTRLNGHIANYDQYGRNDSVTPVHRYYIEESFTGRNTHDRNASHGNSKKHGRTRIIDRDTINNHDYNIESTSLGRFSKSASRLANDYERDEQFTSTQTLPRKLHLVNHSKTLLSPSSSSSSNRNRLTPSINHHNKQSREQSTKSNQSRHYGSMINISIKNAVNNNSQIHDTMPIPAKPERTYKSSLSRSKSFNVLEASTNGTRDYSHRTPYKSNTQLNRLDETPPLKSPGILASINRSNRDLYKAEY
ncbi:hypothetical protein PV326_003108, partial [Microctonus aethiopoides]